MNNRNSVNGVNRKTLYPNYLYCHIIEKCAWKLPFVRWFLQFGSWQNILCETFFHCFCSKIVTCKWELIIWYRVDVCMQLNPVHNKIIVNFFRLTQLSKWIKQIHRRGLSHIKYDIIKHHIHLLYLTFPQHKLVQRNNGTSTSSRR